MVVISSTTNEWPQSQAIDEKSSLMAPTCGFLMEKATSNNQEPHPHPHPSQLHGLRCPRCDSSNTKFCYYNNYSLSQPRHFCKACKRYWTRGGSLRNVPVGGGCRKNKRVKKQPSSSSSPELTTNNNTNTNPSFSNPTTYTISSGPSNLNPLFFGFNPRVSSSSMDGFDYLQPQLDSLGLGFSSAPTSTSYGVSDNGFSSINSLLVPPNYCSPTMATLLASSFKGDTIKSPLDQFQTFSGKPLDGLQVHGNNGVKMEPGQKLQVDWSLSYHQEEHQLGFSSDPNSFYWHDPANLGPSVTSLI